jgi:hypothetical protein
MLAEAVRLSRLLKTSAPLWMHLQAADWGHRLEIFGLDLRDTPTVEAFCRDLVASRERLDFIVNNACQTVRRPPDFFAHMMAIERPALRAQPDHLVRLLGQPSRVGQVDQVRRVSRGGDMAQTTVSSAQLSQVRLLDEELVARADLFPAGQLDQDLQQVDLRDRNSWRTLLADVPTVEMLEVQLVNAVAPFLFNARLKPLMVRTPSRDKHIVNHVRSISEVVRVLPSQTRGSPTAKLLVGIVTAPELLSAAADHHRWAGRCVENDKSSATVNNDRLVRARRPVRQIG